jgi:hypothetical protein
MTKKSKKTSKKEHQLSRIERIIRKEYGPERPYVKPKGQSGPEAEQLWDPEQDIEREQGQE